MPTTTPNLGLTKDAEGEPYSLARINANSDRIDTFAGEALTDTVYDTTGTPALIKKRKIAGVETPVTIETPDTVPTEGSNHLITSDAVHAALGSKQDALTQSQLAAANSGITAAKLTADETALGEVINGGAAGTKNLAPISTIQKTTTTAHYTSIIPCYFKAGTYHIKFGYTTVQVATFVLRNKEGTTLLNLPANIPKGTGTYNANFTISEDCYGYHIYGENAVELTDIMICRKTLYDANPDYEPYAPAKTNVEITPALVEVVDSGAKNIADMGKTNFTTATSNGVTVSRNGDVFTINGTSDTNDNIFFNIYYKDLSTNMVPAGDWVASITPTNSNIRLRGGIDGSITKFADYGAPLIYTIPEGTTNNWVRIVAKASTTFNNETFRLMICTKAEWDVSHTYEPYALSNPVITSALIEQVDNGAKNHLYCDVSVMKSVNTNGTWSGNAFTHNSGVTFTINSDSSITVNGTASDVNGVFVLSTDFTISQGDWILSGTPTGGSSSTYNTTIAGVISDIGNTARFSSATNKLVRIYVIAGTTVNNLLFKPMICSADDWAISQAYVPYGKTNPELTTLSEEDRAALVELVDAGAKNLSSVSSGIISNPGGGFPIPSTPITAPIGTYIVSFRFSGNATRGSVQFRSGLTTIDSLAFDMVSLVSVQIEITSDTIDNFNLYSNSTATVSEFMICTAADWAISHKFVPYCPSMAEMYEMIQALQSGTRSAPALAKAEPEVEPETGEEEMR